MVGNRFGNLLVIDRNYTKDKRTKWNCVCDCGNKTIVEGYILRKGLTISCGCKRGRKGSLNHKWRNDLTEEDRKLSNNRNYLPEVVTWKKFILRKR